MDENDWTREAIKDFVAGSTIYLRDGRLGRIPVPGWLRAAAEGVDDSAPGARLASVHPDDRGIAIQSREPLLDRPWEIIEYAVRIVTPEGTFIDTMRAVNLLGHRDVRGILQASWRVLSSAGQEELIRDSDERFGTPNWVMAQLDAAGHCLSISGMTSELFACDAEDIVGRVMLVFMHPETVADVVGLWASLINDPESVRTTRLRILRPDDAEVWVEAMATNHLDADGGGSVTIVFYDIQVRRKQEELLRSSRESFRVLAESFRLLAEQFPAVVFRSDSAGIITFGNARWQAMLHDLDVPDSDSLHAVVHVDDWATLDNALQRAAAGSDSVTEEMSDRSGTVVLSLTCRSVNDGIGPHREIIGTLTDVTPTAELRRELHRDPVTGALNRLGIEQHLRTALVDQHATILVLFVDLDGFKHVNDTYGHDIGDLVLLHMAKRLQSGVRPSDAVGRYGGDEFVVVCHGVDGADPEAVIGARIAAAMKEPITWTDGSWLPAASIGSTRAHFDDDVTTVLRRADHAMFDIKRARHSMPGHAGRH